MLHQPNELRFDLIDRNEYACWYSANRTTLEHRSPFHEPAWMTAVAAGLGFSDVYIGAYRGADLTAAFPSFTLNRGPVRFFGSPLRGTMTSYLGPVGLDLPADDLGMIELSRRVGQFARRRFRAVYVRLTLRDSPPGDKPEIGPNWHQQRPGSYRLDLSGGEQAVWDRLKSDCRRNIRRAIKSGIEIEPLDDPARYYAMLDRTMRRHGSTSFQPPRFFDALYEHLESPGFRPLAAIHKGRLIAGGLFYADDRELHYLSGASEPENGSMPTSYLLHWHALREAMADGVTVFNSEVSRVRSIDRFKESFRPRLDKRHTLIWTPPAAYRAQKRLIAGHHWLRRVKARMTAGS